MGDVISLNKPKKLNDQKIGQIKWWNSIHRMGYIIADGEEYLITDKKVENIKILREGLQVKFVPYESIRGLEARDLEIT